MKSIQTRIDVLAHGVADNHNRLMSDDKAITAQEVIEHNYVYLVNSTVGIMPRIDELFALLQLQDKKE